MHPLCFPAQDKDGCSPLELAEDSGRQSALEALRKLQLRVKMQEKRRKKAQGAPGKVALPGELGSEERAAKEAEAAEAAAQLLRELELEAAAKAAKTAKKKKKSRWRGGLGADGV